MRQISTQHEGQFVQVLLHCRHQTAIKEGNEISIDPIEH